MYAWFLWILITPAYLELPSSRICVHDTLIINQHNLLFCLLRIRTLTPFVVYYPSAIYLSLLAMHLHLSIHQFSSRKLWLIFVRNYTGFLPEEITFFYSSWIFSCMRYSYEHRKHILIHYIHIVGNIICTKLINLVTYYDFYARIQVLFCELIFLL